MKMRLFASFCALAVVVTACAAENPGAGNSTTTTTATTSGGIEGPVFIDSTEILYLESFPVQVRLLVRGSLPTPCHQAQWSVDDGGEAIEVSLWSLIALGQSCAQVLEPFEVSIPLGSFKAAALPVFLNGDQIGEVTIGEAPASGSVSLIGAGWSFGMCGGFCKADMVLIEGSLTLTGGGWTSDEPLFVNGGMLTADGLAKISKVVGEIAEEPLEDVYGCPDCADGGASYVVLDRGGVSSRHDMEFGRPPAVLAELHGLAMAMIDALETCDSDELVVVADDCEPWQGF